MRNADWPNDVILDQSISTVVKLVQLSNVQYGIVVTFDKPVTDSKFVHHENIWVPLEPNVIPVPKSAYVILLQS